MDFTHPHFAEPRWLWLAVAGPLLVVLLQRFAARARQRQLARFAAAALLPELGRSHSAVRRALKDALLVLAVATVGVALARPQWGETAEFAQAQGEDILFVLDCSRSMLAADVRPDRLTRAKLAIQDFVQEHGQGRVGLVAFAGQAFLQCPLTFDYDAFREALLAVDDRAIPVPGTDIGRALEEAYLAMEKNDRHKIMVLVTDGEDLEQGGVAEAKRLADKGVVVFTIGVGSPAGSPILVTGNGGRPDLLRDRAGEVVLSRLDETTLRAIAEATRGRYQPLGALGEGMTYVRRAVESASLLPGLTQTRRMGVDRFHLPVAAVILFLVSESLIGTRRRVRESPGA